MRLPVKISYRGVEKTEEIDTLIRTKASHLDRFCDHVTRCDVAVEKPNHAQHSGSAYRVRVDVTVPPGHELVADEKQSEHEMHEPLTKIINDAFKNMERQVKELAERQRHEVKTHAEPRALLSPSSSRIMDSSPIAAESTFISTATRLWARISRRSRSGPKCVSIFPTATWVRRPAACMS